MPGKILVLTGRYQLGNKPGLFQDALYVGLSFHLPVSVSWVDEAQSRVTFFIETHDVETWGAWDGHAVILNGQEIGRLKDPADTFGRVEIFEISVDTMRFIAITGFTPGAVSRVPLQIILETQPPHPGLADDFVLTRIDTNETAGIHVGW